MPMTPSNDQPIDRIFAVIGAIVRARRALSLAEIGAAAGLPAPTVHRMVGNLEERGLLKRAIGSKKLVLPGPKLIELSSQVLEAAVVADEPHAILERLAAQIQEHCQIGTIANGEVLYIDAVQVRRASGLQLEQGRSAPLHCTSIGKLYLASLGDEALDAWLDAHPLVALAPNTITERDAFAAHIREVRKYGWAFSNEEYGQGVIGCAVVIPLSTQRDFLCIGMSGPSARVPFEQLPDLVEPLRTAAAQIAAALGDTGG
ncbi:IclR family transcriptional regulator [Burkholderia sp. Ax-1724]|nr:IclR family transcriptional regulator [Burkholderia sp. Ax-1724]